MTKFGDAIESARKMAACDHVMSIRTADETKRVWVCAKCRCRFTTWPGTAHWDWPTEALATRDATIASLTAERDTVVAERDALKVALEGERARIANAVIRRYATSKSFGNWSMLAEDTARFIMMLPDPDIARQALETKRT